jgi:thioredoxin reductase (NADPH)
MVTVELLRTIDLFRDLSTDLLGHVADNAADIWLDPGEYVVNEGEIPRFVVVVEGRIEVTKRVARVERVLDTRERGEYFGEVPMMLGAPAFANARAAIPSRVIALDEVIFHRVVNESQFLSAAIARSTTARVAAAEKIVSKAPVVTILGCHWDPACHDLRDFLARNQVPYDWISVERNEAPVVRLPDGRVLTAPTLRELACAIDLSVDPSRDSYDVVIIGGGPAGLAAAVYGASEGLTTLMIEHEAPGGQAGTSSRIENYLGFPAGLSGSDLASRALQQATRLGAEIVVTRTVESLNPGISEHVVTLDGDTQLRAQAIILALGVSWRTLDIEGIDRLTGRGVYYGAARAEAPTIRGKDVYLIGGGNSAGQAAVFFSDYARMVTIICRGATLAASMSAYLIEQLAHKSNVHTQLHSEVVAVEGDSHLNAIVVRGPDGDARHETDALFTFIGGAPRTQWLPDAILCNDRSYVITGRDLVRDPRFRWPLDRDPFLLETSVPGIFAAGDVRCGSIKRVAAAVGEGSMAIAFVHQVLADTLATA